jgi:hypothetical protein
LQLILQLQSSFHEKKFSCLFCGHRKFTIVNLETSLTSKEKSTTTFQVFIHDSLPAKRVFKITIRIARLILLPIHGLRYGYLFADEEIQTGETIKIIPNTLNNCVAISGNSHFHRLSFEPKLPGRKELSNVSITLSKCSHFLGHAEFVENAHDSEIS